MNYISVCSGIEAATTAWHPLGWKPVAFSEIDPFCCNLLSQHYPDVPNMGDLTEWETWIDKVPEFDVLVGGTPCQGFSVAGKRGGMRDPRSLLAWSFLGIAEQRKPAHIVWENVPGIFSDSDGALYAFLNKVESIGYAIVGFDVLDAQWFGLAQRRRRVFVWAWRVEDLLKKKTTFSAHIVLQCLAEIWQNALGALSEQSNHGVANWDSESSRYMRSLRKRMQLFGLHTDEAVLKLLNNLDDLLPLSECEPSDSDSAHGRTSPHQARSIKDTRSDVSLNAKTEPTSECRNIVPSWKNILAEALKTVRSYTISTATNETTQSATYMFSQAALLTASLTLRCSRSSPNYLSAAASSLTALQEAIAYARPTSTDLFTEVEWVRRWSDFLAEAEPTSKSLGDIRAECFDKILPLSESLSGNSPPRREAWKAATYDVAPCIGASSRGFERAGDTRGQDAVIATYGIPGNWIGRKPENGGNAVETMHDVAPNLTSADRHGVAYAPVSPTLRAGGNRTGGDRPPGTDVDTADSLIPIPVAFTQNQEGDVLTGDVCPAMGTNQNATGRNAPKVNQGMAVRRLTPLEAERLQGFPDFYTQVPYRNKQAADGPRYKALGNSMAVNVMSWIGRRIQMVSEIKEAA